MMMTSFSLQDLAQGIQARCEQLAESQLSLKATHINTDTRTVKSGEVFLALRGNNFDGHRYLTQAQKSGAVAAIVDETFANEHKDQNSTLPLLIVADTLMALGQAGLWNRKKFNGPLIAITGSAGKTSVKSMAAHVMQLVGNCWATPGNFNNHIGAPLTLLGLEEKHQAAVIELGASGKGEIAYTAQFAQPDVAIITNVSGAHLEGFGSIETIMKTKGEIIDSLSPDGCAVLNADDQFYADWLLRAGDRQVLSFGINNFADVMAKNIICDESGCRFDVVYLQPGTEQEQIAHCEIPLLGQHNVLNALSAIAAGLAFELDLEAICSQLKTLPMVHGRLQWVAGEGGIRILNDSYNASPASVKAAIDVLSLWKEKAWLVLGDMAELGDESAAIHAEMGEYAGQKGIENFVATGRACRHAVEAFKNTVSNEVEKRSAHWFEQQSELLNYINKNKQADQVFLVKGSRSAAMDKVVSALALTDQKNKSIQSSVIRAGEGED